MKLLYEFPYWATENLYDGQVLNKGLQETWALEPLSVKRYKLTISSFPTVSDDWLVWAEMRYLSEIIQIEHVAEKAHLICLLNIDVYIM